MMIDPEEVEYQEAVNSKDYLNGEPPAGGYKYGYALSVGQLPEGIHSCNVSWASSPKTGENFICYTWKATTPEANVAMSVQFMQALRNAGSEIK
jgi:hypothetical protein